MRAITFVLTPAASKRLIAKAVVSMPEVQRARKQGRLIVAGGITNAYIAEELTGEQVDKARYTAGLVTESKWSLTPPETRLKPLAFEAGQISQRTWPEVLQDFTVLDVFVKGGNALDPEGNVGVLVGGKNGGTIGAAYGHLVALGAHLILPVGLEKLIPSVAEAARALGQLPLDAPYGMPCGLFPVAYGTVVTEVEALRLLYGLKAVHVHSGGVGGSEGAVGLVAHGDEGACHRLRDDLGALLKEKPVDTGKRH
ncbi:MAG: hypothetical protein DDT20_00483 [Firmicutes bacterium]|nr:hypothetical protein [Bacillota bacterium]